jgi:hypothetical protein
VTTKKWAPRGTERLSHFEPFLWQSRTGKYWSVK